MAEHKVRLARTPDEEVTVGDAEYTDLQRMGLLAESEQPKSTTSGGGQATTPAAPKPSKPSKDEE